MTNFGAVTDNAGAQRFELAVDGDIAFAQYMLIGDTMHLTHTLTPPRLRGRGIATTLARGALDVARERGLKVVPTCWFIAQFIDDNPEYRDLLAAS